MPTLNQECIICKENFQSSDDIYSTSCGHIFHEPCLRSWQTESKNCAQCRRNYPTVHKLYITLDAGNSFNNSNNLENSTNKLKLQLKNATDQINNLHNQIQQYDEQYAISQELIKDLERKTHQSNKQYMESKELLRELKEKVQYLTIKNRNKSKEIRELKTSLETAESQAFETGELSLVNLLAVSINLGNSTN